MPRTVFVNPRRRARKTRSPKRRNGPSGLTIRQAYAMGKAARPNPRKRRKSRRRNAGISPFVQPNPLIMPNPRRRRRKRNPLTSALTMDNLVSKGLSYGGGAAIAVGANALLFNRVDNFWARNAARFVSGVVGAAYLKGDLGGATAGAMFYPLMQDLASRVLGRSAVTGTEADIETLAADLEDVMDEMDEGDFVDDDFNPEDDDLYVADDDLFEEDDILT